MDENISLPQSNSSEVTSIHNYETPQKIFEVKPAGAWSRYWAFVIDGLVFGLPAVVLTCTISLITQERFSLSDLRNSDVFGLLSLLFYFSYNIYFTTNKGTTVGKDAYGLKVVKSGTDQKLTYKESFLRGGR